MNVSIFSKMAYENISDWTLGKNKPNSNPIKPNFKKAKMNVNLTLTKDYRKKDDFSVRINKPKTNPISEMPKMNVSLFTTKDYENKTTHRPKKTNPNKANFTCPQRHALSYAEGGKTEIRCRMSVFGLLFPDEEKNGTFLAIRPTFITELCERVVSKYLMSCLS